MTEESIVLSSSQPMYGYIIYFFLLSWSIFSIFYIVRLRQKGADKIILDIYDSIPSVFTTIGILGTFSGIYFGLRNFDTTQVNESIPELLEGLKTAFTSSIWGILLSLIFRKVKDYHYHKAEEQDDITSNDIPSALNNLNKTLQAIQENSNKNHEDLKVSLIGESDKSIGTSLNELLKTNDKNTEVLDNILQSVGGDGDTSLLSQIQKIRIALNDNSKENNEKIDQIITSLKESRENLANKFDEFSQLLAKNNTEALVEVMKNVTEQFNSQMSALIEKLVQENFQELNNSVQKMNDWQAENKNMITQLTDQFKAVSNDFEIASGSIKEISKNTSKLTDSNSQLSKLIEELQKVMIEDTKYQEIVTQLTTTIDTLKSNTDSFDKTTEKLNNWVKNQMNFTDSISLLLTRLEKIEEIKDINDVFWNNTKKQLNEGVSIIENVNKKLSNDLEDINAEFYERLNNTLQNLDNLIQRIIENYDKNGQS